MTKKRKYRGILKSNPPKDPYAKSRGKYKGIQSTSAKPKTRKPKFETDKNGKRIRPMRVLPPNGGNLVQQLPPTTLSQKGLTARQLLENTPNMMRVNGKEVTIKNVKKAKTQQGRHAVTATVIHYNGLEDRRPHEVTVIGLDQDKKISDRGQKVMCSCDCENYYFVWEYANAKHGAAKIIYGNGEPPTYTNPHEAYGLCKHLSGVVELILRKKY